MANTKKNVREEKTEVVEKISIAKNEADAAPAVKAESVPAVTEKAAEANETKKEAPKTEKKRGRKPAAKTEKTPAAKSEKAADAKAEKAPAAKSEKTKTAKTSKAAKTEKAPAAAKEKAPAAKKDDAPKTEKKRGRKPAAAKAETKAPAKTTGKRAAKKTEEKAPAKRGRKKSLTYASVVDAARKKTESADISRIKYPIAVNFELKGSAEGIFYVVVSDGKITVEPYKYDDYDVYIEADAAGLVSVLNGQKNIYDALADGTVTFGNCNLKKTILFINAVL